MPNNWCPEIYRSVFIDRQNDDQIRVAPCCNANWKLEKVNTFNFYTSPYLLELRQQFDQGEKPKACNRCWDAENIGHKSRRQSAIEFFNLGQNDKTVQLESLDYSATWACNLACVMCGPEFSSTWSKELELPSDNLFNIGRKFQRSNDILSQIDFSKIKKVHFNGGEPLLNNDQIALLTKLDEMDVLKDVFISYNTNGTVIPSDQIIELWSRARLVKLFFSIDATDAGYEYVRYPGNWKEVSSNLKYFREQLPSNVMFGFNSAVGAYNIFEMADVWHWFDHHLRTNREGDHSDFCWQFVYNFDIKNLSQAVKEHAIHDLSNIVELQGIVAYLQSTINYKQSDEWVDKLDKVDQRRGTNWRKSMRVGKYY